MEFLEDQRDSEKPFLCYLSLDFPHAPSIVPPGYEERYRLEDIPDPLLAEDFSTLIEHHDYRNGEIRRDWEQVPPEERKVALLRYFALVTFVDECLGQAIEKLEEIGKWDSTLVCFTSDHGEMLGDRNHRFSKFCLYEGSVRVPLILSGGLLPSAMRGTVDPRPCELVDILPTLQDAAELTVSPELPGLSLLTDKRRIGTFAELHGTGYEQEQEAAAWCWRTPKWKLILHLPGKAADAVLRLDEAIGELYDLRADPGELHNRYDDSASRDVRDTMMKQLCLHVATAFARYPRKPTPVRL